MRILEVTESFATGTMEVVRLVSEGAALAGHQVAIAYGERPETPPELRGMVAEDVELIPLPWTGRTAGAQIRTVRALRDLCRRWDPDVIHLHSSFAGFIGALTVRSFAPTVYTPHGYSFLSAESTTRRTAYRLMEGLIARRVTMVGAVSNHEAELARGVGAHAVEVVPNGVPELDRPKDADSRHERREPPMVVALGRIVPARRPAGTAEILEGLSDVADVCWIGGPGADHGLEDLVRSRGIPVTGWLDRDEAIGRLSEATVLLHWSAWDSHPLSVLEAMAFDVVVVGSDVEANLELLGPDQVRATEHDAGQLVRALLDDPELRAATLDRQRQRRARFAATRMVDDWLRVYAAIADRENLPANDAQHAFGLGSSA